ncbi:undecaprenyl-diphosphate phosphatase, partial [Anaerofustis sp.]
MTTIQAIILGIIQGLTEFLPVSSSGHLVILQNFMGITEGSLEFTIVLHL